MYFYILFSPPQRVKQLINRDECGAGGKGDNELLQLTLNLGVTTKDLEDIRNM